MPSGGLEGSPGFGKLGGVERKVLQAGQKRLKTPEVAASRGADDGCLSPPGLRSWSGGTPGDSAALPVPARTCCLARR